ncbi:alpha/beta fold hydrolase [Aspergillus alliaceus]|uniref:alpha/beta fold hydrolase n=1 Tax=Petromyces alliaceus TaxID=209559 RepID=UPI0012A54C88|nr:epoxide hydrolase [Aspergillus alliaceus]KAB8228033.1 epoxide hydrolase [Aspergillus alliaceus]
MASIAFPSLAKKATLCDGTTYGYVSVPASTSSKPTFLLLHGFPSSCYDWRHQIIGLQREGYGVIAPDLLGYGDTDKPSELTAYLMKVMSGHMVEIMEREGVLKAFAVGHDWGTTLASRLANYHPNKFHAIVTLAVAYIQPGLKWNIDKINADLKKILGYEPYGYWTWYKTPQSTTDCNTHPASTFNLTYPTDPCLWRTNYAPTGKAAEFVRANRTTPLPRWFSLDEYTTRDRIFAASGYEAPLNWYRAAMAGVNDKDEEGLEQKCPLPNLFVGAEEDYVCVAWLQVKQTEEFVPVRRIECWGCGHWVQLEEGERLNGLLREFAGEVWRGD